MLVKDFFEQAIKQDYKDLQALIMFVAFEKKVVSMDEDARALDLYFLEKHNERMNKELMQYKQKIKMSNGPFIFEMKQDNETVYIYANNEEEANYIASKHEVSPDTTRICSLDELMEYNGMIITFKTIVKDKKPQLLGGFK